MKKVKNWEFEPRAAVKMTLGSHTQPKNHMDSHWACAEIDLPLKKRNKYTSCRSYNLSSHPDNKMLRSVILIWRAGNSLPAAVGWFRASSSMIVAVRYLVSYLYLNAVSSGNKRVSDINYFSALTFCYHKMADSVSKSPSTMCSSSCVCVSGTFFCCSGVTVPRANTTSTSALSCSYTEK